MSAHRTKSIDILRSMTTQLLRAIPDVPQNIKREEIAEALNGIQRIVTEWTGYGFTGEDIDEICTELHAFYGSH